MQPEKNETRRAYIQRIHAVLDFVERNLAADLSLEQLSGVAHYSPYHFHRVFSTMIGESLNGYVNRKRIERIASILLVGTDRPIKELAYSYGFNSENSFSRTFKKYYGISPSRFKSEGKTILSKIGIEPFTIEKYICRIDNIQKWIEMNAQITVKELPEIKLAGIMHIGEFEKIGKMYERLMAWGAKNEVLPDSDFKAITIYHDNPGVTQSNRMRYSTCVTINRKIEADGEIRPLVIQKGNYAVGHFVMDAHDFPKAWESMHVWVLENDLSFRDGDYFEVYLNDHQSHPEQKFVVDICIPIERNDKIGEVPGNKQYSPCKGPTGPNRGPFIYHQLIGYMNEVRTFFQKAYATDFKLGSIYRGNSDFSYFSLKTEALKKQKLKFVIVFDHQLMQFRICLSGQNKSIRRQYWEIFKNSYWDKYRLAASIDDSLWIIDHLLADQPDFEEMNILLEEIETESFKFMDEIAEVLVVNQ